MPPSITSPITVPITCQDSKDTDPYVVDVPAYPTAVPGLVINPGMNRAGWANEFVLTHVGSGRILHRGDPWSLRAFATSVDTIDWTVTTADEITSQPAYAGLADRARAGALTEPSSTEHPAYDAREGQGKGLKRTAVAMARDFLADLQWSWNCTTGTTDADGEYVEADVQPDEPDPSKPGETRPNWRWIHEMRRQCDSYGIAYLLLALHRTDPIVADSAAAALADAWEAGDSVGEWGYEWADNLLKGDTVNTLPGVPTPVDEGSLLPQHRPVDALFEAQDGVEWQAIESKLGDVDVNGAAVPAGWAVLAMQDTSDPESVLAVLHVEHATTADGKPIAAELAHALAGKLTARL